MKEELENYWDYLVQQSNKANCDNNLYLDEKIEKVKKMILELDTLIYPNKYKDVPEIKGSIRNQQQRSFWLKKEYKTPKWVKEKQLND